MAMDIYGLGRSPIFDPNLELPLTTTSNTAPDQSEAQKIQVSAQHKEGVFRTREALGAGPNRTAFDQAVAWLTKAGLSEQDAVKLVLHGATAQEAKALLTSVMKGLSLASYGPALIAARMLNKAIEQGGLSAEDVGAAARKSQDLVVLRPDGYLSRADTGAPIQNFGPIKEKDGALFAANLEVGNVYAIKDGVIRAVDDTLSSTGYPIAELEAKSSAILDGVEAALVSTFEGLRNTIRKVILTPDVALKDAVEGLVGLPRALVTLVRSSPALLERFANMTEEDQIRVISQMVTTLMVARFGGAQAAQGAKALKGVIRVGGGGINLQGGVAALQKGIALEIDALAARLAVQNGLVAAGVGASAASSAAANLNILATRPKDPINAPARPGKTAAASMKRVGQQLSKEAAQAGKKELGRLLAQRKALIQQLEAMLSNPTLAPLRRHIQSTLNAVKKHLKDSEITGALRDMRGDPVRAKGTGRPWSHDEEALGAVRSLENLRGRINRLRGDRPAADTLNEFKALSKMADSLLDFTTRVRRFWETNQ